MADLTTSTPVDDLMQATTKAGIATAAGVGTGDSPTFAGATVTGTFRGGNGSQAAPTFSFTNATGLGMYQRANVAITFTTAGNKDALDIQGGTITLPSTSLFGFSSTAQASGAQDAGLARASAGVVEINNGTAGTLRDLAARNVAASTAISAPTVTAANYFAFSGAGGLYNIANGVFRFADNAGSDFGRLTFGGTTSSFPALKRSGTGLQVRLADDSADAPLTVSTIRLAAYTVATLPTPAAGMRAYVTDSNAVSLTAGIGAVVAAGGSTVVPVFYDGTNWRIA